MVFRAIAAASVAAFLLLPASGRAQAVDPEARALAQQIMDATMTGELIDSLVGQSWPTLEAVIRKSAPMLRQDQILALKSDFIGMMREELKQTMSDTPDIYAKYFSVAEMRDMMAFYQTDTGKKMIAVMPAMMGDMMQKSGARMPAMMQGLMERFKQVLAEKGVKI